MQGYVNLSNSFIIQSFSDRSFLDSKSYLFYDSLIDFYLEQKIINFTKIETSALHLFPEKKKLAKEFP